MTTTTAGSCPRATLRTDPDAAVEVISTDARCRYPRLRSSLDKLSSVFLSGNKTRDDQPNHIRIRRHVHRDVADLWGTCAPRTCTRSAATTASWSR